MSRVLKKKVFYINMDGKRYRFTEIIEIMEPTIVEVIDLTQEDEEEEEERNRELNTPEISANTSEYSHVHRDIYHQNGHHLH